MKWKEKVEIMEEQAPNKAMKDMKEKEKALMEEKYLKEEAKAMKEAEDKK